jgi:hypothetical protein
MRDPLPLGAGSLCSDPLGGAGAIVERMRCSGGKAGGTPLALGQRLLLDSVLAEGGEVDHQVGGVEDMLAND